MQEKEIFLFKIEIIINSSACF